MFVWLSLSMAILNLFNLVGLFTFYKEVESRMGYILLNICFLVINGVVGAAVFT